ncbi:MAG: ribonuclease BN [Haloferacaceae archaeon]
MTSLSEAYGDGPGTEVDLRRLYLGTGLFVAGVLLVVAGILVAGTELLTGIGYSLTDARLYGGVLGGLGVPAVFLGISAVLPASRTTRAAAVVGAAIAILGVAMFWHAYPCQWIGSNCGEGLADLTLATSGVYFLGTVTTFWCLFAGIANFKTRNDPGGTVTMEITRKGETKIVEVERGLGGLGGIGFLGSTPDGDVDTQTNRDGSEGFGRSSGASSASTTAGPAGGPTPTSAPTSDGGAESRDLSSPLDSSGPSPEGPSAPSAGRSSGRSPTARGTGNRNASGSGDPDGGSGATADRYCGSCAQFRYVRTPEGMQPYCDFHDEEMDDMEACDEWTPRGG